MTDTNYAAENAAAAARILNRYLQADRLPLLRQADEAQLQVYRRLLHRAGADYAALVQRIEAALGGTD